MDARCLGRATAFWSMDSDPIALFEHEEHVIPDIDPLVLALFDETGYQAAFDWCDRTRAHMTANGVIKSFDIDSSAATIVGNTGV